MQETDASGTIQREFVYGDSIDDLLALHDRSGASYAWYFYRQDDQGNVVALLDASGAVVERYRDLDHGAPRILDSNYNSRGTSAYGNPYMFTGRRWDAETGFYYFRHRYYDPTLGRFTTRDPIGIWGDALNLGNGYTYAGNNPWSYVDPWGLEGGWLWSFVLRLVQREQVHAVQREPAPVGKGPGGGSGTTRRFACGSG